MWCVFECVHVCAWAAKSCFQINSYLLTHSPLTKSKEGQEIIEDVMLREATREFFEWVKAVLKIETAAASAVAQAQPQEGDAAAATAAAAAEASAQQQQQV